MSRLNHARHQHRGRRSESALPYRALRATNDNRPARAANAGRILTAEERARIAAQYGNPLAIQGIA